ncbi:peptide ABC transporter substrate-binding protein, partial [Staphylococcus saprophyticus]
GTVALGSAALLAACGNSGSSSSSSSKDIQWNLTSPIQTLDSSLATDTYSNIIIGNTNAGLTRVDKDGKAQPELAKSVDVSK